MEDTINISDFTEDHYRELIQLAKKNYQFISYDEIYDTKEPWILWRHDIDYSVHRALALAKIEADLGVRSTYFILLSSIAYNVFEPEIKRMFLDIKALGHNLGLHFDPTIYDISDQRALESKLTYERNILSELFDVDTGVFSFHNPTEEILLNNKAQYAGMINTYSEFFSQNVPYCSDSNGYWRHKRIYDFISEVPACAQVLTHPVWWQEESMLPRERIMRSFMMRAQGNLEQYDDQLRAFGRKNIGLEESECVN